MKKTTLKKQGIALAALLTASMLNCACDKESIRTMENVEHTQQESHVIYYYVNGTCQRTSLSNDAEWDAFLERMLALAKEGYNIRLGKTSSSQLSLSKEKVTFVTTDLSEMKQWVKQRLEEGYEVEVSYNEQTGEYTGVAIR